MNTEYIRELKDFKEKTISVLEVINNGIENRKKRKANTLDLMLSKD